MKTILRLDFKEAVKGIGYRPGSGAGSIEDPGDTGLISSVIDTGQWDSEEEPGEMIGRPPGQMKKGLAPISSLCNVVVDHLDAGAPLDLALVGHSVREAKVVASLDAVI